LDVLVFCRGFSIFVLLVGLVYNMSRPEIIEKIRNILHGIDPTAEVIVYGSEARGDARESSDIDLLILVNKKKLAYRDITRFTYPLYDLEITDGITVSPLVYTRDSWEKRPFLTPFYLNVMNEGIRL